MSTRNFLLKTICCLVVLSFTNFAVGQKNSANPAAQLIQCSITVDHPKIERKRPTLVSITVENISGRDIDLKTNASFKLLKNYPVAIARNFSVWSDSYWSPLDISTGKPLKLIANPEMLKKGVLEGRVPEAVLHFTKGEVKTFRVELDKLLWNNSRLNDWPRENLFDIVEKGKYWLVLELTVQSNKVEVTIE
jgi:hypothetical protein